MDAYHRDLAQQRSAGTLNPSEYEKARFGDVHQRKAAQEKFLEKYVANHMPSKVEAIKTRVKDEFNQQATCSKDVLQQKGAPRKQANKNIANQTSSHIDAAKDRVATKFNQQSNAMKTQSSSKISGLAGNVQQAAINKGVTKKVNTSLQTKVDSSLSNSNANMDKPSLTARSSSIENKNVSGSVRAKDEVDSGPVGQAVNVAKDVVSTFSKISNKLGTNLLDEDSVVHQILAEKTLAEKSQMDRGNNKNG